MDWKNFKIDKTSNGPIFQQLAHHIQLAIENGALNPGDKLPTERELAEKSGLARGTVKSALRELEEAKLIEIRRGSGSYVLGASGGFDYWQKKEAVNIITAAIDKLESLGLNGREITNLFNLTLSARETNRTLNIAIIDSNQEALYDFKRQLSYMTNVSISIFILESITMDAEPERLLESFDLIITPSLHFQQIAGLTGYKDKIIEAAVTPSKQTTVAISALKRSSRIGIICRTNEFLSVVKETLLTYGFAPENIQSFFEMDYTVETYFPGGIHTLISFSDAHIFTSESFKRRNEELRQKGGSLIQFEYNLERGTLIYIEDRINSLLK